MSRRAPERIDAFEGEWEFLSNYYAYPVTFDGITYPTAEHAYQAAKTLDPATRLRVLAVPSPDDAKRVGREAVHRPNWQHMKLEVMHDILSAKFTEPQLRDALLTTGNATLIEGNDWGDVFWGKCGSAGQNHLGRLLMELRSRLRGDASSR
ncbi:MAG: NADAR family protein [Gemmatimonadaceae bacterium]